MQPFLELVARDLLQKLGPEGLMHTAVVFPNKRARLFFNEHLATAAGKPLFSPAYMSISELFRRLSPHRTADPVSLVCRLHSIFCRETGSDETLDDFYFWGELLVSDFDDVDKNLVDADRLFANLHDLHHPADDFSFLEPEQEEAIRRFFSNFSVERRTELKERFITLWDKLGGIYHSFRRQLSDEGIAYEGMMYRGVIEHLDVEALPFRHYVFVGFNVLNAVEHRFFRLLANAGRALFYWDYDTFYTTLPHAAVPPYTHEAGEFILRNLKEFPSELPPEAFDNLRREKRIRFVAASTENAQARFVREELRRAAADGDAREQETAVVLCNETLLLPVLHSIPPEVRHLNITMGFPLSQTPVHSYIGALVALQTDGYRATHGGTYRYEQVLAVLKHPYVRRLSDRAEALQHELTADNRFYPRADELRRDAFLERIFTPATTPQALCRYLLERLQEVTTLYRTDAEAADADLYAQLYRESLFKAYTLVARLGTLMEEGVLSVLTATFRRLLAELLTTATIPFHGEPAVGIQVMGVLETRNLDFRRLLMLSVNEGQLPRAGGDASFIPYSLRKAYGMTTVEHKNAVYAYYFYRLIQRAEDITLLYNTSSDGLNRGEMSRFMLQLLVEAPHDIAQLHIEAGQAPKAGGAQTVEKTAAMIDRLCEKYDATLHPEALLSPSALNAYMDCRLRFYYRYVAALKVPDEVSADIDSALFGTIFHRAAQLAYEHLTAAGPLVQRQDLQRLLADTTRLQGFVDSAFKELFFHIGAHETPAYNGTQLINARVVGSYLQQLLRIDLPYAPFRMEGMEQRVTEEMEVETPRGRMRINVGGTIDRMDSAGDTLRIVDYKTGGLPKPAESIEQLFTPGRDRPGYVFQTFLYAAIMCRRQTLKVAPALLYIHRAASDTYSPIIEMGAPRQTKTRVDNFGLYEDEFRDRLRALLGELFDPSEPFNPTDDETKCAKCDFRALCGR
ncbi:MAG: PD-(D/E)XK nuclease family protein [Prevotellaceae bacterium]|jgi:hypothetical protein|nr:PD-(D/E)XK nuclease family protein [Prevotellaceae bacterium]